MHIELQNIVKSYPGNTKPVLDGISLTIESNCKLAIVGPSGSGKSTLLNLIGTLDFPSAGKVMLDGKTTGMMTEKELTSLRNDKIGFVFQTHMLLPQLTVVENILLPVLPKDKSARKSAQARAEDLLHEVGLSDKSQKFPGELSVGECQRVAVIRALINQPTLLLADEPTGSLDQDNSEKLGDLLLTLAQKQAFTMVIVTHAPELAAKMDETYRILNGRIYKN